MGASGRRQLEVVLNYRDNLSGKAGRTVSSLRAIDKAAGHTLKTVEALTKALGRGGVRGGARGGLGVGSKPLSLKPALDNLRLQTQQTRLQREQVKLRQDESRLALAEARTGGAVSSSLVQEVRLRKENARLMQIEARPAQIKSRTSNADELADVRLMRERIKLQREADRLRDERKSRRGGWGHKFAEGAGVARDMTGVARETFDTLRGVADPALKNIRAEKRFELMGFTPEQNRTAFGKVDEVVRSTRGVRRVEVVETLSELINTFGEVEEAVQFLPITARFRANMEALYGDKFGPAQISDQIGKAFKSLELLGIDQPTGPKDARGNPTFVEQDRQRMERYFNITAQAMAATGGDIDMNELNQFVKYMRIAGTNLTPEGLQKLLPLVQQMGGAQAGTGLMTLYTNLIGGRIPVHKLRYWEELGLLDKSKVEYSKKTDEVKRLLPGAIPIAQDLGRDPVAVADRIAAALAGKGIDITDKDAVNKQLMAMLGDRTGLGELAQMINFRASIAKEVEKNARSFDINKTYDEVVLKSPLGGYLDLQAQWENTKAMAGRQTAEQGGAAAGYFADALRSAQDKVKDPVYGSAAVGVMTLGRAAYEAADILGRLGGGKGGSGGGSGVGSGVGVTDVVAGGWGASKAGTWLSSRLGLAGTGAAGLLGAGPLAVTALGVGSTYALHSQYQHDTQTRQRAEGDAGSGLDNIKRLREQHGGRLPEELARQLSVKAFPGIDRRGLLNELDVKTYGTAGYPGVSTGPRYDRDAVMAGGFARRAPELQYPELMRGFIADIRQMVSGGAMTQQAGDRTLGIAQKAFPEAYKTATDSFTQEVAQLTGQVTPLTGAFINLQSPTTQLATGLGNAQGAAQNFASRVNALDLTVPVPTLVPFPVTTPGAPAAGAPWKPPQSAVGSVVQRDGLVHAHRGNVIVPARLSRRSPGDWLEDFDALRAFDRETVVQGEGAGKIDYSAFHSAPASRPAPEVNVTIQSISVPAGGDTRQAAAAVAAEVAAQVREALQRLAALEGDLYDPRFIANMAASEMGHERARA